MVFTATASILLDEEAFNQLVAEEDLKVWEVGGYIYTKKRGKSGIELYRTYGPKWAYLYTARRVATNANAAGNPILIDISIASGQTAKVVFASFEQATAGAHVLQAYLLDEDNAVMAYFGTCASAATGFIKIPNVGTAASASNNITGSIDVLIGPGQKLTGFESGASANANDTMTIALSMLLPITAKLSDITWSAARSTDAANITIAANTISAANEWQAVLMP